jgi:competence protein ComEC
VLEAYPQTVFLAPERLAVPAEHYRRCHAEVSWRYDDVNFQFLHPAADADAQSWSENDASCVLLVQSPQFSLLLPGDIEQRAERWLVAKDRLPPVDLVIAPHHGSRTSSTPALVAATSPDFVVFSAGYRNQWGFPLPDIWQRWLAAGACPLTTGELGALVFEAYEEGPLQLVKRYRLDETRIWSEVAVIERNLSRCRHKTSTN